MNINIVLVEPEIPQNAGNIARTCAASGISLHMVKPLGFSVEDRYLKRAGLDYWDKVNIRYYDSFHELREIYKGVPLAAKVYTEIDYEKECFIVFGKETA